MAPRPKNPPPDRRQEILEAALQVFAQKGFATATNADIARAAGVTPAALYYYFPSKEELFKAVLRERQGVILPVMEQLNGTFLDLPPQVVLPTVARNMVQFLMEERTQAVLRIVVAEGPRNPEIARIYQEQVIDAVIHFVLDYLAHQMELGTIRKMPPPMVGVLMAGPMVATVLMRDFLHVPVMTEVTNEELLRQITETVIPALLTETPQKE
ncbi:MAG TPA: TetR/AcrR family transcriptional regulator [Symbiobacteriaceae bacterium]|jgi:AcrR family transcriptional regulator